MKREKITYTAEVYGDSCGHNHKHRDTAQKCRKRLLAERQPRFSGDQARVIRYHNGIEE